MVGRSRASCRMVGVVVAAATVVGLLLAKHLALDRQLERTSSTRRVSSSVDSSSQLFSSSSVNRSRLFFVKIPKSGTTTLEVAMIRLVRKSDGSRLISW